MSVQRITNTFVLNNDRQFNTTRRQKQDGVKTLFNQLDKNKDGKISVDELVDGDRLQGKYDPAKKDLYSFLDMLPKQQLDLDGVPYPVDTDFFNTLAGPDRVINLNEFKNLDSNKSGKITQDEVDGFYNNIKYQSNTKALDGALDAMYSKDDTNHDGKLSRAEIRAAAERLRNAPELQTFRYDPEHEKMMDQYRTLIYNLEDKWAFYTTAGKDKLLSREEIISLDTNKDGQIKTEEIPHLESSMKTMFDKDIKPILNNTFDA